MTNQAYFKNGKRVRIIESKPVIHNGIEYYPDENGWYDIECVGTDKSALFGYYEDGLFAVHAGYINDEGDILGREDGVFYPLIETFTHWQPCPKPPELHGKPPEFQSKPPE